MTVPSCWYLLQEGPAKPSHHEPGNDESHEDFEAARKGTDSADGDEDEGKDGEKVGDEGEKSEDGGESSDESEIAKSGSGDDDGEKSDESPPSGTEGEKQGSSDPSGNQDPENTVHETEAGEDVEGVRGKGATKDGPAGDTRKHIPDAKGYNKKRIESDYGKAQSPDRSEETEPDKGDKVSSVLHVVDVCRANLDFNRRRQQKSLEVRTQRLGSKRESQTPTLSTPAIPYLDLIRLRSRKAQKQRRLRARSTHSDHSLRVGTASVLAPLELLTRSLRTKLSNSCHELLC